MNMRKKEREKERKKERQKDRKKERKKDRQTKDLMYLLSPTVAMRGRIVIGRSSSKLDLRLCY